MWHVRAIRVIQYSCIISFSMKDAETRKAEGLYEQQVHSKARIVPQRNVGA